jgi:hypothetical protein
MEQKPTSEADSRSADQEISRLSFNFEVHYAANKKPP